MDKASASREILWNVSSLPNVVTMYVLFAVSMLICGWGIWKRYTVWAAGAPADDRLGQYAERFKILFIDVLGQRRVNRERKARGFHTLIFWGFLVLLFTTTMVFIDHDLGIRIYQGHFYLAVTLLSDLFGLGLLLGVAYAIYIRYVEKPDRLHSTNADIAMLAMLGLMGVQGFLLEGLRIQATSDPWAWYSPVGLLFGSFFWSLSGDALRLLHFIIWWFHTITVFTFFALLPYTKFLHIVTSSANLFFKNISRPKGALPFPGDLEKIMEDALSDESAEDFHIGVSTLENLSWKTRLDLDACTSCGRCQSVCPAYNSGKALSPKWLILDTKAHMHGTFLKEGHSGSAFSKPLDTIDRALLEHISLDRTLGKEDQIKFRRADNELVQKSAKLVGTDPSTPLAGGVMEEDVFWSCTTCRACMEVCPVGIDHVDYIVEARRSMALMEGNLPAEAQASLRAIETRGNPFGPAEARSDWTDDLDVPFVKEGDSVDILYWVGCVSAFDKRKQKIAKSMTQILNASGESWGILGNLEKCTGDPGRRLGEENLFQASAKSNIELLQSISFKTIVANCPHCFNSIKNEYPQLGQIGR